ncbi:MAG: flagellar hook-associated protein FlgK, partial [Kiloniellaceae bacterium]
MSLLGSLLSAVSGLQAAQAQLQITANNIANVNTAGYTRKTVTPETAVIDGAVIGVRLSDVQRTVDEHLLRQLRAHIASLSGHRIESYFLTRTQSLFGSVGNNTSLSHTITTLGSALEALAVGPDNLMNKTDVVDAARRLADQLNFMSDNIQQMRLDAERQIKESVDTVNKLLTDIHELNRTISRTIGAGDSAPDLEDQRDVLLNKLAEEIAIQYFRRPTGEVVISTLSGRTLLDSVPKTLGYAPVSAMGAAMTYQNGLSGILYGAGNSDITQEISGGRLAGLLTARDNTLVDFQAEIDRLSEVLRDR